MNKQMNAYMSQILDPGVLICAQKQCTSKPVSTKGDKKMKKVKITIEQKSHTADNTLNPEYPLIAACYSRHGLIHLAVKKGRR